MQNKRGVMLSMVALFIILLVLAIIFMVRYSKAQVYNADDKFHLTNAKVVGYGVYDETNASDADRVLNQLKAFYTSSVREGKVYLLTGNSQSLDLVSYEEISQGSVGVVMGGSEQTLPVKYGDKKTGTIFPQQNKITIQIDQKEYSFKLRPREISYFVIYENGSQEVEF